ncbi:hypothetical protein ACFL5G_05395 [Candidatus Margulisiibacteriota bacterium]
MGMPIYDDFASADKAYKNLRNQDVNRDMRINKQDEDPNIIKPEDWPRTISEIKKFMPFIEKYIKEVDVYPEKNKEYQLLVKIDIDRNGKISQLEFNVYKSILNGKKDQAIMLLDKAMAQENDETVRDLYGDKKSDVIHYFGDSEEYLEFNLGDGVIDMERIKEVKAECEKAIEKNLEVLNKGGYASVNDISDDYLKIAEVSFFALNKVQGDLKNVTNTDARAEMGRLVENIIYVMMDSLRMAILYNPRNYDAQKKYALLNKMYLGVNSQEAEKAQDEMSKKMMSLAEDLRLQEPEETYFEKQIEKDKQVFEKIIDSYSEKFNSADSTAAFIKEILAGEVKDKDGSAIIIPKEKVPVFLHILFNAKFEYSTDDEVFNDMQHPNTFFSNKEGVCDEWAYAFNYIIQKLNTEAGLGIETTLIFGLREGRLGHVFCLFKNAEGEWRAFQETGISNDYYSSKDKALQTMKILSEYSDMFVLDELEKGFKMNSSFVMTDTAMYKKDDQGYILKFKKIS